ncbi:alpha-L-fucosidase, partial [Candidatus Sumerlaeota bacterium]|nr:alpha-L-fucosidase [Candidatus Sumerlaeota bacterium]
MNRTANLEWRALKPLALLLLPIAAICLAGGAKSPTAEKPRLLRSQGYFGLHFDLHPNKNDTVLGADVSEENIRRLLERVRPDFIQYDCKGHAGYTGYPTKVGWPSPGIVKDSLAVWRKVTREMGVALGIHYSGVWDSAAVANHPEWARIDASGKPDSRATSTFGPYVDKLLIPQLREVFTKYDIDFIWADGECWATQLDYSPAALAQWKKETGLTTAPRKRSDPHWLEWKNFHRRQFEKYLGHWVDAIHESHPRVEIASNWMYSTFAPKPVERNVDYISGDYSPTRSVDRARSEARYMSNVGAPWDLLAWGFDRPSTYKPAIHLMQEAVEAIAHGGAFSIYYNPTRSGYVSDLIVNTAGQVADFCRARQKISFRNVSVPQIVLLNSAETHLDRSDALFQSGGTLSELDGALHALLELRYSVDVMSEWNLQPLLREFPLVVIPDSYKLSADFCQALLEYVERGGNLLLLGEKCARLFEPALGVVLDGKPTQTTAVVLASSGGMFDVEGLWQDVTPTKAKPIAFRYVGPGKMSMVDIRERGISPQYKRLIEKKVAATLVNHGKGKIAAVYGPVALAYFNSHHPYLRQFVGDVVKQLFPKPMVEADGPSCLEIALRRARSGQLTVHLLNLANMPVGEQRKFTDSIPPLSGVTVRVRLPNKPKSVVWVPGNKRLAWKWSKGILTVPVPAVDIHGVVVV